MDKTALVTGGAGGLGGVTSRTLANNGWHVFVADFDDAALQAFAGNPAFTPIKIDVTKTESVKEAYQQVAKNSDTLSAIVNFAGVLAVGSMIEIEETALQRVLDVNLMGTFRVNKAFFPLLQQGSSRIVNISSETGWQSGAPFNGAYAASKHAVEAYSDSLRRELALLEISVIKIQPGAFKTNMVGGMERNFRIAADHSKRFKKVLEKMIPYVQKEAEHASDPEILANAVLKALSATKPKAAYSIKPAKSRAVLEKLPTRVADYAFKSLLKQALD
ncbi:MAG: SDR family NAD(P)-dependent oxidoreductase [Pseudomonadales bacterium]|nr:SDR family NAD(P)-dependent oxidoreductase [Pseudomonadales bacterium]